MAGGGIPQKEQGLAEGLPTTHQPPPALGRCPTAHSPVLPRLHAPAAALTLWVLIASPLPRTPVPCELQPRGPSTVPGPWKVLGPRLLHEVTP